MLKQYFFKLMKSTVLQITGFISFFIAFVLDYIFPNQAAWVFYASVVVISLLIGGFDVFRDLATENERLNGQLKEYSNSQPKISLKFRITGTSSTIPVLWLSDFPQKPDINNLVIKEKEHLLSLQEKYLPNPFRIASLINEPNPTYLKEVDQYLLDYREYLEKKYECSVDRAYCVFLIINNIGGKPASDITIDLIMPRNYVIPKDHQRFDRKTNTLKERDFLVETPIRPNPHIDFTAFRVPILEKLERIRTSEVNPKTNGPEYIQKDFVHVVYAIDKIVQHTPIEYLDPFWIWLGDVEEEEIWDIPIRITCTELQLPVMESLVIQIRKPTNIEVKGAH